MALNGLTDDGNVAGFGEGARLRVWKTDDSAEDRATLLTFGLGLRPRHDVGLFVYGNRLLADAREGRDDPASDYATIDGSARRQLKILKLLGLMKSL